MSLKTDEDEIEVPAFILKLQNMVSTKKHDALISWNSDGRSFIIRDQYRFAEEMLPRYFKHCNMASFVRQLNKYGFRKIVTVFEHSCDCSSRKCMVFQHPYFVKDYPSLVVHIKRKAVHKKDETEPSSTTNLVESLLRNVHQLKVRQSNVELKFSTLNTEQVVKQQMNETEFAALKNENSALWREVSSLKQLYEQQQNVINQMLKFLLVGLPQNKRNSCLNNTSSLPLMLTACPEGSTDSKEPEKFQGSILDLTTSNKLLLPYTNSTISANESSTSVGHEVLQHSDSELANLDLLKHIMHDDSFNMDCTTLTDFFGTAGNAEPVIDNHSDEGIEAVISYPNLFDSSINMITADNLINKPLQCTAPQNQLQIALVTTPPMMISEPPPSKRIRI